MAGIDRKHIISITLFLGCWIFFVVLAYFNQNEKDLIFDNKSQQQRNQALQESFFKNIDYYVLKEFDPYLHLNSSEVSMNSVTTRTLFFDPRGKVFSEDGEEVHYSGMKGTFNQKEGELHLDRDVFVSVKDTELRSEFMVFNTVKGRVDAKGNVKTKSISKQNGDQIYIDADRAISWTKKNLTEYYNNVVGKIVRKRAYEDQVDFKSNKLYLKMDEQLIQLDQDVWLKKQPFIATSRRGDVYLGNYNKRLKYFALYDDVKLEEKVNLGGASYMRKAFAETLEGIVSEDKLILTGLPKVYQQNDVIRGNKIILRENNEVVEVDDANTKFNIK